MKTNNEKLLSKEQVHTVKLMIIESMRDGFKKSQKTIPDNFENTAGQIADMIIHTSQMALGQGIVFDKILKKEAKKSVKKVVIKVKKHARK